MRIFIQVGVLLLVCASTWVLDAQSAPKAVDMPTLDPDDPPAVMLYTIPGMEAPPPPPPPGEDYNPPEYEHNRVQVAAWSDGRIVWSHDLKHGGSPYYRGKIERSKVLEVYRVFTEETSGTRHKYTSYTIPDAPHQNIAILSEDGKTGIEWQSAHPVFEDNKKLIYTSRGVSSAESYVPPEVPTEDELNFQSFRRDFDRLKAAIQTLPPGKELRFK